MKTLITFALCSFMSLTALTQNLQWVNDVGLTSGGTYTSKTGLQLYFDFIVADASFRYTQNKDGRYMTPSVAVGATLNREQIRWAFLMGLYGTATRPMDKDASPNTFQIWPGASVTAQRGIGIFGLEYNGQYCTLSIGIAIFHPKIPGE